MLHSKVGYCPAGFAFEFCPAAGLRLRVLQRRRAFELFQQGCGRVSSGCILICDGKKNGNNSEVWLYGRHSNARMRG